MINTYKIIVLLLLVSNSVLSQIKQSDVFFNGTSDTTVYLREKAEKYEITTKSDSNYFMQVYSVRGMRPLGPSTNKSNFSSYSSFSSTYISPPKTGDRFILYISTSFNDTSPLIKVFHINNIYQDSLAKRKEDSINSCNASIISPYAYKLNIYINDVKTDNYKIELYKTKTEFKRNGISSVKYSDSIITKTQNDTLYFSERCDSLNLFLGIGENAGYFFDIKDINFKNGGELYFAVSTNDKKLLKKYKNEIKDKKYSELRHLPYLSIAKHYEQNKYAYRENYTLYIDCNILCNSTNINFFPKPNFFSIKK